MKRCCTKCYTLKPVSEFGIKDKVTGRLRSRCLECQREDGRKNYRENLSYYKLKAKKRNAWMRRENENRVIEYLERHSCIRCGEKDIRVLCFTPAKGVTCVSRLVHTSSSWKRVLDAINRSTVLCVNCLWKQNAKKQGWMKGLAFKKSSIIEPGSTST